MQFLLQLHKSHTCICAETTQTHVHAHTLRLTQVGVDALTLMRQDRRSRMTASNVTSKQSVSNLLTFSLAKIHPVCLFTCNKLCQSSTLELKTYTEAITHNSAYTPHAYMQIKTCACTEALLGQVTKKRSTTENTHADSISQLTDCCVCALSLPSLRNSHTHAYTHRSTNVGLIFCNTSK